MKAELKIGNLVNFNDTIAKVLELRENQARIEYIRSDTGNRHAPLVEYDRLEGVKITDEWLVKFGFEQANGIMCWRKEGVEIVFETLANYFRLYPRTNKIEYVHQLQNLYFALMSEELTPSNHEPQS